MIPGWLTSLHQPRRTHSTSFNNLPTPTFLLPHPPHTTKPSPSPSRKPHPKIPHHFSLNHPIPIPSPPPPFPSIITMPSPSLRTTLLTPLYLTFFTIHIPIMLLVDLYPLYPVAVRPAPLTRLRGWYLDSYKDRFFREPGGMMGMLGAPAW